MYFTDQPKPLLIISAESAFYMVMWDVLQLLDDEQFVAVDKIKTIGNVYMFSVGLKPQHTIGVRCNLI